MPTIRLGDEDRERYGCPEWIEFPQQLPTSDAEAIDEAGGTYLDFFRTDARGFKTQIWVAMHRAGVTVPWKDWEFNLMAVRLDESLGKGPSSTPSGSTTPPTSASSTRRSTRSRSKTSK